MSAYCKGLCCREDIPVKTSFVEKNFYRQGIKFCRTCNRWLRLDSIQCPCCKQRTSSKSRKYKRKQASSYVKYPKVVICNQMVAKTIHITEDQAEWLDDNAYNVSRLCRKVLSKIMNDEIAKEFFIKNKTKSRCLSPDMD